MMTAGRLNTAVTALRQEGVLGAVTMSEKGSMVLTRDSVLCVPAYPIKDLVDTTGAGDLYASGFLSGLARGRSHMDCARLGAMAAAEVIQHIGARPQQNLAALANFYGI